MDRVYVANLPPDIRIKDIDDFFRPFGKLVYIDVNHRAKPVCAFVQFDSARNAFNAVKARHGYDYEGYTLQLRLMENEVRKRRDATPPPPPPPMFNNFERPNMNGGNYNDNRMMQNYSGNPSGPQWSNNNRSDMEQYRGVGRTNMLQQNMDFSLNNRSNMQQSGMMPYSSGSRPNMGQQFPNAGRPNMQQQFSNDRSDMQQEYSNSGRSNIQEQYSNRPNMPQLNNFNDRPGMMQQNMPFSASGPSNMQQQLPNGGRSNIPQLQTLNIQHPDNNSLGRWNDGNVGNNFDNNNYNNAGTNANYNPTNDRYAQLGFEDRYTIGLSGAGRKWFNRFIRKGFSPEMARAKALEHRKLPYLRGENKTMPITNDPTNVALETIGTTIMSLLSANPTDNIEVPGPSSAPPPPQNAVSRRQYLKSVDILKSIKSRGIKTSSDRISFKYHTQIVKDYQKFNDATNSRSGTSKTTNSKETPSKRKPIISNRTEKEISELMIKQKAKLLKKARELGSESHRKRMGGAFKKRFNILMDYGFLELEAKSLAWNTLESLEELLSLKKEYDLLAKKTDFIPPSKKSLANAPKNVVYRNDLRYLEEYSKHRIKGLSKTILYGLTECLKRIHAYEKSENLSLTQNKFTKLLLKITARKDFFKNVSKTTSSRAPRRRGSARKQEGKESKKESDLKKEDKKVNAAKDTVNKDKQGEQAKKDQQHNEENNQADEPEIDGNEDSTDVVFVENDEDNDQDVSAEEQNAQE